MDVGLLVHFNSIKVQLELLDTSPRCCRSALFQFHKGTIRTSGSSVFVIQNVRNFNSIKVQLEHAITLKTGKADLFQFHKGTIRT